MKPLPVITKSLLLLILVVNLLFISCKKKTEFAEGELKWRYKTAGSGISSPAIGSDGTIFFASYFDDYFYAMNPTGKLKWKYEIITLFTYPVIGTNDVIYFEEFEMLYALNPDGTLKWQSEPISILSSPVIGLDSTIYASSGDFILVAFDHKDGWEKWKYIAQGKLLLPPAIDSNGIIYVGSKDSCVYAITPECSLKWYYKTGGYIASKFAISNDNIIYFGTKDSCFNALNPDGTLKWRYKTDYNLDYDSPAIDLDGTIYFGADNLYALNPNGTLKWKYIPEGKVGTSPAIDSDGIIYFGSDDGYLNALNSNGTLKWRFKTNGTIRSPTIGKDSTIYFSSSDGYFYAVKGSGTLAKSSWPKFQHDLKNTGRVGGGK